MVRILAHKFRHARSCRWRSASRKNIEHRNYCSCPNPGFGLPIPVCSNDEQKADLYLETNVRLPSGNIHVGFEGASGDFALWVWDSDRGEYRMIADTETGPLDISFAGWRRLVGGSTDRYSSQTPIYVTSTSAGTAALVYRYWGVFDGKLVEDVARQTISSVDPLMMVDHNRDGAIDDADVGLYHSGRTYRFWTNPAIDDRANGTNDVVNFFPVKVDVSRLRDAWGDLATYTLRNWDADIRCCALDGVAADEASSVWTDDVRTKGGEPFSAAIPTPIGSSGVDLGTVFPDGRGILAVTAGDDVGYWSSPEIVVHVGDAEVYCFRLPMTMRSVRDMYRFLSIRGCCGDDRPVQTNPGEPVNLPDDETDGRHFVFVHGYSVDPDDARVWADTMFKRLLLSGSRSAFTAVTWFGDYSKIWESVPLMGGKALNYYRNVQNAFNSASPFKTVYDGLSGNKVILAHSLGNMLVSSAIVDHGLNDYGKYYMLNAAVPMEAYNEEEHTSNMVDSAWLGVPSYWASRWYQWFDESDFRAGLTWKGRFGNIPRAENCYSPTEDVLSNPSAGGYGNAWGAQELLKGTTILHAANLIGSNISVEGGWGINSVYATESDAYLPIIGFDAMYFSEYTREQAITLPLFTPFDDARMHITNTLNVVDASLRAKMLGDAIPAESFAAGRNELSGFVNFNYQSHDDWPSDRNGRWLHSDIKDVAYRYVRHFFQHVTGVGQ